MSKSIHILRKALRRLYASFMARTSLLVRVVKISIKTASSVPRP